MHPENLNAEKLPEPVDRRRIWEQRLESIRDHEKHLARNGTVILKFWLNVSKEEQQQRFLCRLNEPEKHWKFSASDVCERGYWNAYMQAYEQALAGTSRARAPWYAIPADNKHYMRLRVAEIVVNALQSLGLKYPAVSKAKRVQFAKLRRMLEEE